MTHSICVQFLINSATSLTLNRPLTCISPNRLTNIYRQLQYPPDFAFDGDDEDDAEVIEACINIRFIMFITLFAPFATGIRHRVECPYLMRAALREKLVSYSLTKECYILIPLSLLSST